MRSDPFWQVIDEQLAELCTATTTADVMRILRTERNPYGSQVTGTAAFFAGSGGDGTVYESLQQAGWSFVWSEANYHFAMRAPNGDIVTYVEGDIYPYDTRAAKR